MNLPTKDQVNAVTRHIGSAVGGAILIFGLSSKIDPATATSIVNAIGPVINDIVVVIGIVGPLISAYYASRSASPSNQVAAVKAIATGPASAVSVDAQKAIVEATSAVAHDTSIPASKDASQALIAATIALPEVKTIVTDKATADAAPSPNVVSAQARAS